MPEQPEVIPVPRCKMCGRGRMSKVFARITGVFEYLGCDRCDAVVIRKKGVNDA